MGVVNVNEALVGASIEQIEAMALAEAAKNGNGDESEAGEGGDADVAGDQAGVAGTTEQDVNKASSGQGEGQTEGGDKKVSDKELNFAKLRTKAESLEHEVRRLAEENKRLAERQYVVDLPEDHAQQVAAVDARLTDIGAKFQDGELTWEEYQSQLREANAERESLVAAAIKADISREMREQAVRDAEVATKQTWQQTVDGFIASKPDSVDYTADESKFNSLNTYVKALGSDPDNDGKPMEWFLQEAHSLVKAKFAIAATPPRGKTEEVPPAKPGNVLPFHTLGDVPGGIPPAKSEVEQLDHVSGAALTNRFLNDPAKIDQVLASLG